MANIANLKLEKDSKIYRFSYGEWIILIIKDNEKNEFEAWLQHKDYGVMSLMFGTSFRQVKNGTEFLRLVVANIDGYINCYQEDYFDDEEAMLC